MQALGGVFLELQFLGEALEGSLAGRHIRIAGGEKFDCICSRGQFGSSFADGDDGRSFSAADHGLGEGGNEAGGEIQTGGDDGGFDGVVAAVSDVEEFAAGGHGDDALVALRQLHESGHEAGRGVEGDERLGSNNGGLFDWAAGGCQRLRRRRAGQTDDSLAGSVKSSVELALGRVTGQGEVEARGVKRGKAGDCFSGGDDRAVGVEQDAANRRGLVETGRDDAAVAEGLVQLSVGSVTKEKEIGRERAGGGRTGPAISANDDFSLGVDGQRGSRVGDAADARDYFAFDAEFCIKRAACGELGQRDGGDAARRVGRRACGEQFASWAEGQCGNRIVSVR